MTYQEFIRKFELKDNSLLPASHKARVGASLAVQVHSSGARPAYVLGGKSYTPETYDKRYDELFQTRILNRHPNEATESYNWRLSVYSPIGKEIFDRFLNFANGCILQPNNYVISTDDVTQEYINKTMLPDAITEGLEYILNNPRGYMAVIIEGYDGDMTKSLQPKLIFIAPEDVLMQDDESIAFKYKGEIYYLNSQEQTTKTISIPHKFGTMPCWDAENNFSQPFVTWADQLGRNFSDDEMMTKQYSYPIKQIIQAQCAVCTGSGIESKLMNDEDPNSWRTHKCSSCNGTGIMSVNPGEHLTITEEKLYKSGLTSMPDMAKFITPDVAIPEYHMKRWQTFYERAEKALYLSKKINGTESGDAKKEDRRDQYVQLSTISRFLFEHLRKAITYISAYLNYNNASGKYEPQQVIVIAPKQLDLMTDADLVSELIEIQGKSDDSMILGETQYAVTNKVYRDDVVQGRINDILYEIDNLYGVSGAALQRKYLSGMYSDREKTIHEKGYKILLRISRELTPDKFVEASQQVLTARFEALLPEYIVTSTIYQ